MSTAQLAEARSRLDYLFSPTEGPPKEPALELSLEIELKEPNIFGPIWLGVFLQIA